PAISPASSSRTGAIIRHGPLHGAHMSTTTGRGERSTSLAKVASVTATGFAASGSGFLHRPQIGAPPAASFSRATRFTTPQDGQRTRSMADLPLYFTMRSFSRPGNRSRPRPGSGVVTASGIIARRHVDMQEARMFARIGTWQGTAEELD